MTSTLIPGSAKIASTTSTLLVLSKEGEVLLVQTKTGRVEIRHRVPEGELDNVTAVNVFGDRKAWLVNVEGISPDESVQPTREAQASELRVPAITVSGQLACYKRGSRMGMPHRHNSPQSRQSRENFRDGQPKPLWVRVFRNRTLLLPDASLPFLVTASRVPSEEDPRKSDLMFELIDRSTGKSIERVSGVSRQRYVHVNHDRSASLVTLHGEESNLHIEYARQTSPSVASRESDTSVVK